MLSDNVQHQTVNPSTDKRTKLAVKRVAYPTPPQKIFDKYPATKGKAYRADLQKRNHQFHHPAANHLKSNTPFLNVQKKMCPSTNSPIPVFANNGNEMPFLAA